MEKSNSYVGLLLVIATTLLLPIQSVSAQVLEEIVVTAQRREQSIQEVPISLEAYSGEDLISGGMRTIQDVELFSPSVEITTQVRQTSTVIRGMGSSGGNYSIDPAAPIFMDGIHFGRSSMISGAFLDVDRLEILRGPQPIHFGQNATAGAFSITTRRPTPEWEGDITAEIGNFGRKSVEAGAGGPITDTLGIRVAGQWDESTGHMIDVVDGGNYPYRKDMGGRITLVWQPTEAFGAEFKAEYMSRNSDGDPTGLCRAAGNFFGVTNEQWPEKYETAVLFPGEVPQWDAMHQNKFAAIPDCADNYNRYGVSDGDGDYFRPIAGIRSDNNRGGFVDMLDVVTQIASESGIANPDCPLCAQDPMDAYNYRLGLNYRFDNGMELEAITGMVDYLRNENEDPQPSPFFAELALRTEKFDMWSQELRLRSEAGGTFEWEVGAYYQTEDLDLTPAYDLRAGLDRPARFVDSWGDNRWKSAFGTVTFNFLGDKASIDVGGRYTDVHKESYVLGSAATLIFDVNPDPDGDGLMPDTAGNTIFRFNTDPLVTSQNRRIINCATPRPQCGSYGAGYYTHLWRTRQVPALWAGHLTSAVDIGAKLPTPDVTDPLVINGTYRATHDETSFDPQITLRYRPNENMSFYAKWAQAFKAGGFDTGAKAPPASLAAFSYQPENAENWETGIKGTLFDGSVRYDASLFWMIMENLQGETSAVVIVDGELLPQGSDANNSGKARNRGLEFDLAWAATEQLTLGASGSIMDAIYVVYTGAGCNDMELAAADTGPCLSLAESQAEFGTTDAAGTIDRTGLPLPRTPDWKFSLDMDYWHPLFENYKGTFDARLSYSDGFITDVTNYELINSYDKHTNLDVNIGFGDMDDVWAVSLWGRNLTNARLTYHPEADTFPNGHEVAEVHQNQYMTYGIQLQFNFQ